MSPLYRMSPRPGLAASMKVVPDGWAEHNMPVLDGTRTVEGTIHRIASGPPPYPNPDGYEGTELIHAAFFRVQQLNREGGGTPGEQPTVTRQYLITTSVIDCPPLHAGERGDLVRVLDREFKIQSLQFGSLLWEIDLICVDNMTQQNPTAPINE